jgi:hypothetical protein
VIDRSCIQRQIGMKQFNYSIYMVVLTAGVSMFSWSCLWAVCRVLDPRKEHKHTRGLSILFSNAHTKTNPSPLATARIRNSNIQQIGALVDEPRQDIVVEAVSAFGRGQNEPLGRKRYCYSRDVRRNYHFGVTHGIFSNGRKGTVVRKVQAASTS